MFYYILEKLIYKISSFVLTDKKDFSAEIVVLDEKIQIVKKDNAEKNRYEIHMECSDINIQVRLPYNEVYKKISTYVVYAVDGLGILLSSDELKLFLNIKEKEFAFQHKEGELVEKKLELTPKIEINLFEKIWEILAIR